MNGKAVNYRKGTNLPAMGDYNRSVVLETIRENSDISRIEISRMTGLTAQTVTNIVRKLLEQGLVYERGLVTGKRGKPRTSIRLNKTGRFAVGVHVDPAQTTIVLINLAGDIIARARPALSSDADEATQTIACTITQLLDDNNVPYDHMGGIGLAVPGPLDIRREVVLDPPNLSGWRDVPITKTLNAAAGFPVLMEKDVTAACHGEAWAANADHDRDFLFVYTGLGIAFGVVKDGEVYQGLSGNEGEIGHIVVDIDGPRCWCGQRGCVAVTCDPRSLVNEAERLGLFTEPTGVDMSREFNGSDDLRRLDSCFSQLCQRAESGDGACESLLRRAGYRLGRAVTILADLFDMEHVIGGGPYWQSLEHFYLDEILGVMQSKAVLRRLHSFTVKSTALGGDIAAVGAASAILDRDLTPRTTSLILS